MQVSSCLVPHVLLYANTRDDPDSLLDVLAQGLPSGTKYPLDLFGVFFVGVFQRKQYWICLFNFSNVIAGGLACQLRVAYHTFYIIYHLESNTDVAAKRREVSYINGGVIWR